MYAIVEIAGKQYRVRENLRLRVPLLSIESGKKVEFDNVLVYNDDKTLKIGSPRVEKVKVSATVLEHNREKKIIVFKKKRRKGYQVKNGHRQDYSLILVDKIGAGTVTKPSPADTAKKEKPAVADVAVKTKTTESAKPKVTPAAKTKPAAKPKATEKGTAKKEIKTTTKKPAAKKPAAKTAAKKPATKPAAKKTTTTKKTQPKDKKE